VAEITLRDLCRWDRRLHLLPPAGVSLDAALDRPVSWVVSVRTSPPLLPSLRGDELVVVSRRVLEYIESSQMISRDELLATLSGERIAALLTEPGFTVEPLDSLPVLTMPAPFPQDAEGTLNRLLTERRAELYRLGNELSRRLSQASMDPRGVEGLLNVAAEVAGRALVLQDSDGHVVAHGGPGPVDPAAPNELAAATNAIGPTIVAAGKDRERLIVPMMTTSGVAYLGMTGAVGTLTEADRLVLTQTAGTAAIVMARGNALGARDVRQQAIAELLLGRLTSEAAINARARGLGLDPAVPLVVGIMSGRHRRDVAERLADQLIGGLAGAERAEINGQLAFILPELARGQFEQRLERLERSRNTTPAIAVSDPVPSLVMTPEALRQARFALGLLESGVLEGPIVRCDSLDDIGVFGLLYHLWGNPAVENFRNEVLGELEEYDARRGTELLATLDAYLSSGGSLAEAAAKLNVHRNTLSYRISRIAELSGRDLANPRDHLLLRVALLCRDLARVPEPE
jgi:PucR family transcriptional regulator, purine catabolism regulatory protein